MDKQNDLAERIRVALDAEPSVREVKMFGGLAFMVNDSMVLSVAGNGDLLVRADPDQTDAMLGAEGARQAEMGKGRSMGRGWITVDHAAVADDKALGFWTDAALGFNSASMGQRRS